MKPFSPEDFGRYRLEQRIAIGGMAEIFAAKYFGAMGFQKSVVLKRILPQFAVDAEFLRMFITEAKLVCHLEHPNIVQVYELGEVDGQYYIAMEYVNGIDARQLWRTLAKRKQRLPGVLALFIVSEFVKGLDYAHRAVGPDNELLGVVHRDVSPSNILLSYRGDVKIGDFGIALVQQESTTQAGVLKGKYGYMSPEQVAGLSVDHRSDIFAAGIVLAELILGRRLFLGRSDFETLDKVMNVRLDVLKKHEKALPPDVVAIIRRSLQRDPADRYQSAREMQEEIVDFLFQSQHRITNESLAAFVAQHVIPYVTKREGAATSTESRTSHPSPSSGSSIPHSAPVLPAGITPKLDRRSYERETHEADVPVIEDDVPPTVDEAMIAGEVAVAERAGPGVPDEAAVVTGREVAVDQVQEGVAFEIDARAGANVDIAMGSALGAGEPANLDGSDVLFGHVPEDGPSEDHAADPDSPEAHMPLWDNVIEPDYQFGAIPELEFESDDHLELDLDQGALAAHDTGTEAELASGLEVNAAHHIRPAEVGIVDPALVSAQIPTSAQLADKPDFAGTLPVRTVAKVLFRFGLVNESGLLAITGPEATGPLAEHLAWLHDLRADLTRKPPKARNNERSCEIRLEEGQPRLIAADRSEEALVAHLIVRGHLERKGTEEALRANPHRGVVAALLGSGALAPLHISRHVTAYVLDTVLDTFSWEEGSFAFYRGREPEHDAFPSGMSLMEIIDRGVANIPEPVLDRYLERLGARTISRAKAPPAKLDAFVPNQLLRHLYQLLAGASVPETLQRAGMLGSAVAVKRALYTLVECELATIG